MLLILFSSPPLSMDFTSLFPEVTIQNQNANVPVPEIAKIVNGFSVQKEVPKSKTFASVVSNSICDIPLSQFPIPCIKGDRLAITIPEEEYKLGLEACKHHLHGRVIWSRGASPLTLSNLRSKLMEHWASIGKWGVTSLGKGVYKFAFSSLEDVQRARSVNTWSLPNSVLKLFLWTKYFLPSTLRQTLAQVWIRIHRLSQEYWRPKILFAIASSIDTPICIDSGSNLFAFDRPFRHFVRVLVDLDLTKELSYKILVERVGFSFFVDIEYERIPEFCNFCSCIEHTTKSCKRKGNKENKEESKNPKVWLIWANMAEANFL